MCLMSRASYCVLIVIIQFCVKGFVLLYVCNRAIPFVIAAVLLGATSLYCGVFFFGLICCLYDWIHAVSRFKLYVKGLCGGLAVAQCHPGASGPRCGNTRRTMQIGSPWAWVSCKLRTLKAC
jgi:hypothetical protein